MFESMNEAELLELMRASQRRERVAVAERLLAAGRLCQRRIRGADTENREQWCVDGALFFPQLAASTGELLLPSGDAPPTEPGRTLMMPTRRRTRAEGRAARINSERRLNAACTAADPPPF